MDRYEGMKKQPGIKDTAKSKSIPMLGKSSANHSGMAAFKTDEFNKIPITPQTSVNKLSATESSKMQQFPALKRMLKKHVCCAFPYFC